MTQSQNGTQIFPRSFARAASDLEIKMWIRNNYKEYLKPKTPDNFASDTDVKARK